MFVHGFVRKEKNVDERWNGAYRDDGYTLHAAHVCDDHMG